MGQTADLLDLQRILLRSKTRMSDAQQQNMTRWAVYTSASLLRQVRGALTALLSRWVCMAKHSASSAARTGKAQLMTPCT
jgi:hypothetical protein